ncbi:MAG: hypothetical protein H6817_07295 [Phycisphaerales bacterium]|nr:hypothetical protein [Phycisphaerales bacterium]
MRRLFNWLICIGALVALIWIGRGAYLRLTTPAITAEQAYERYGPLPPRSLENDATMALITALDELPAPPAFSETPPAGMVWTGYGANDNAVDITEVTTGEWTPADRPYLRACIGYLTSAQVEAVANEIHTLRGRPFRRQNFMVSGLPGTEGVEYRALRNLAMILVARALVLFNETHDAHAALDAIRTTLWLTSVADSGYLADLYVALAIERLALEELTFLIRDDAFPDDLRAEVAAMVEELADLQDLFKTGINGDRVYIKCCTATHYADTGDEHGWLMLSVANASDPSPRSRCWDLLTVFHNDLAALQGKYDTLYDAVLQAGALPFPQAAERMKQLADGACSFTPMDDELRPNSGAARDLIRYSGRVIRMVVRAQAQRNAVLAIAALESWRGDHENYPATLEELTPKYTAEVPIDPFCTHPLHYARDGNAYRLWSCAADRVDNEGKARVRSWMQTDTEYDFPYVVARPDAQHEVIAIPAPSPSASAP